MKKIFFILACFVTAHAVLAQEPADALRFSWSVPNGTARQQAIGGAMGSLGGDISATFVNPAGLGFYKTSDFVFTPGYSFNNNKSTYFGRTEKEEKNYFSLGTTGIVLGAGSRRGSSVKSSAFGIAVNRTATFSNNILYRGANNQNSYSQKYLEEIQNNNDRDANSVASNYPFGASLAFNTYWIDTIAGGTSGNYRFQSRAPIGNLLQENSMTNKGGITEFALGGAANFNDKIYLGATLGIPILNYERDASFTEADASNSVTNKFNYASLTEELSTKGVGVNLKAGVIFKPVEYVRLGLAVHSPTFYSLTDRYNASVTTDTEGYEGVNTQTSEFVSGAPSEFKYILMMPYRVIASASYVLREVENVKNQKGFLTADIEYVNYKAASFSPDEENGNDQNTKDYLKSLNDAIDNAYKGAFNFRAGGELKFTTVMVRAGLAYYGNPYKNLAGEKGHRFLLSGGLGYRHKGIFIDVSYVHNMTKDTHLPYRLENSPNAVANIKSTTGNAVLTIGFKI